MNTETWVEEGKEWWLDDRGDVYQSNSFSGDRRRIVKFIVEEPEHVCTLTTNYVYYDKLGTCKNGQSPHPRGSACPDTWQPIKVPIWTCTDPHCPKQ